MSHAYVEVGDVDVAGKILRGEVRDDGSPKSGTQPAGKPRERGSVLGKGRRARGVTVTRSSQEELMADVSPLEISSLSRKIARHLCFSLFSLRPVFHLATFSEPEADSSFSSTAIS